jgi:hypothetical protein
VNQRSLWIPESGRQGRTPAGPAAPALSLRPES